MIANQMQTCAFVLIRQAHATAAQRDWIKDAACRGMSPSLFFGNVPGPNTDQAAAKKVCMGCEVRIDCLEHAIEAKEADGVWGGMAPKERRSFVRRQRRAGLR